MKKSQFLIFVAIFVQLGVWAQVPQLFNYQGVARDGSGTPLASRSISIKATILDGSATGTVAYSESQSITTNQFGLFTMAIGSGTVLSGTFTGIVWSTGSKYLKIEIDPNGGTTYSITGTTELLSVPYALFAGQSGTGSGTSQWVNNATGINYNSGNVGIGTSQPGHTLEIVDNETNGYTGWADKRHLLRVQNLNSGNFSNAAAIITAGPVGTASGLSLGHSAPTYYHNPDVSSIFNIEGKGLNIGTWGATPAPITFATGTPDSCKMIINGDGKIGIGTTSPVSWLNIEKNVSGGDRVFLRLENTSNANSALVANHILAGTNDNSNNLELISTAQSYFPTTTPGSGFGIVRSGKLALMAWGSDAYPTSLISFYTGGSPSNPTASLERMRIDQNGLVGIGTDVPKTKLHVSGGDVYIDDSTKGIVMKSPDGQCWRITVASTGTLSSTSIACP